MAGAGPSGSAHRSDDRGVIGPPWRITPALGAAALALDPPVQHACDVVAAFSPRDRRLERCHSIGEATARATIMAAKGDGEAIVLRGAIQLQSGRWYWPLVKARVETIKALDPLDRKDRALIAKQIQVSLGKAGTVSEDVMLRNAIATLNVSWTELSEEAIDVVFEEVQAAAIGIGRTRPMNAAVDRMEPVLVTVGNGSRRAQTLNVSATMNAPDTRAVRRFAQDQSFYMSNDYGRRSTQWQERDAIKIIESGLRQGQSDLQIGASLHQKLRGRIRGRSEHYFRIVANSAVVRSSSFGQMTSYTDAGIDRYEWVAVMDGPTCAVCRFLHGQIFTVQRAREQFDAFDKAALTNPEAAVHEEMPWYRIVNKDAIHVGPSVRGGPVGDLVARITSNATGTQGQRGAFQPVLPPQTAGGTTVPPAHGLCRCLSVPVF